MILPRSACPRVASDSQESLLNLGTVKELKDAQEPKRLLARLVVVGEVLVLGPLGLYREST